MSLTAQDVIAAFRMERFGLAAQDRLDGRHRLMFAGRVSNYVVVLEDNLFIGYAEAKASLPGETWLRGRDLADGPREQRVLDTLMAQIREREGALQ